MEPFENLFRRDSASIANLGTLSSEKTVDNYLGVNLVKNG